MTPALRLPLARRAHDDSGIAIVIAVMAMSLLLALGLALTLTTITEVRVAANHQRGVEAKYAAEAAVERVLDELRATANWDPVLSGAVRSSFVDGSPGGVRPLPGGGQLDLTEATNLARCGKSTCSTAELVAVTDERPWGANNPVWQLYAFGSLESLLPAGQIDSPMYAIVWVADDPSDDDGDPLRDGGPPIGCDPVGEPPCADGNPGRGAIAIRAEAVGPDGTRRAIDVTFVRTEAVGAGEVGARVVSWRVHD